MTATAVDVPVLTFAAGLPGFPAAHRFVLVDAYDGADGIYSLRSLEVDKLEFIVAAPGALFPDYAPEIDDATAERLGLPDAADALLLVILTVGAHAADATANLLAPIVINGRTQQAAQVVLGGSAYSLKTPLSGAERTAAQ